MRWVYLAIVVLFVIAILIFAVQNGEMVAMSFLGFSIRAPLALLAIGVYALGAITGGSLFALLRRSMQGAKGMSA
jgi:putative membrane protein